MFSPLCAWVELKSLWGRKLIPSKFLNNQLEKNHEMFFHLVYYSLPNGYACQVLSLVLELSLEGIVYTKLLLQFWDPVLLSTKAGERSDHKYLMLLCGS